MQHVSRVGTAGFSSGIFRNDRPGCVCIDSWAGIIPDSYGIFETLKNDGFICTGEMVGIPIPNYKRIGGCAGIETPREDLVSRQRLAFSQRSASALIEEFGRVRASI